jgi:predicted Zn finger-like uncharacterized protein
MILECPACSAKFAVPDAQIPQTGRVVRCGRCRHEWHTADAVPAPKAKPAPQPMDASADVVVEFIPKPLSEEVPSASPVAAEAEPIEDDFLRRIEAAMAEQDVRKPEKTPFSKEKKATLITPKRSARPYQYASAALAAVWLIAALVAYFPSWANAPVVSGVYAIVGATPTDGLVFKDVAMERVQEGGKTKFILSGNISNHGSDTRMVPTVRVSLRNASDKAVWGRDYPVNAELKAGEIYPFRITNVETSFAGSVSSIIVDMGNSLQLLLR